MNRTTNGVAVVGAWVLGVIATVDTGANDSAAAQHITRAGTQATIPAPPGNFTGRARVDPLFTATREINAAAAYVTFEPGARSNWHTHPAGQRLVVVSGVGLTQEWGKSIQEIRPGDVVICPPGVKHWHGASPASEMRHLAFTGNVDGRNVEWMEKVSDEQYGGARPSGAPN